MQYFSQLEIKLCSTVNQSCKVHNLEHRTQITESTQAVQQVHLNHKKLLENYLQRSFQWGPKLGDSPF